MPNNFVKLIRDKSSLRSRSLEFDIGYEGDLDSLMDIIRDVLKSLRYEKKGSGKDYLKSIRKIKKPMI